MISRRELALGGLAAGTLALGTPRQAWGAAEQAAPQVRTTHGPVVGGTDGGIHVFRGLRYGADTRQTRFAAPRQPVRWDRPVEALAYGHSSPQRSATPDQDEDCLFLNVWTPGLNAERRPVMVWIHGGAYSNGTASEPLTDGARLARRGDVVVVSLNHRLNLFGYAYLARLAPGFEVSGNVGQLDQILALQWIRDNIAAFGGDPGNVMLFGQSGGGAKIATLLATPAADGLFHRAATMSGQQVTASGPINATRRTRAWLGALGLSAEQAAQVRELPAERLLEAAAMEDPVLGYGGLYFGPVLDDQVLHRHPFYPDAAPQGLKVPMMIGNAKQETLGFMAGPENMGLDWDTLPGRMTPATMRIDIAPETVIAEYRRLYPQMSADEVLIAATTAGRSWRGAVIEAEERAKAGAPAYVYQQDFAVPMRDGRSGASHGSDIAFVFDTVGSTRAAGQPGTERMVDAFSGAFTAFARTGDPNHAGLPRWTPYSLERRETMLMDVPPRLADDPRGEERRLFARVPYVQPGT
jgi:para-nitrobenzyl esterase